TLTIDFVIDVALKESVVPAFQLRKIGIQPEGKRPYQLANGHFEEYEFAFAEISLLDENTVGLLLFGPEDAEPTLGAINLLAAGFSVGFKSEAQ
ncbi:MAG TPA: hypothetical protein VHQ94_03270, partial [Pyrinomonadaceae bacterium]|nr:hypothetical protein [Pyrinomonadaceae bacterium]